MVVVMVVMLVMGMVMGMAYRWIPLDTGVGQILWSIRSSDPPDRLIHQIV